MKKIYTGLFVALVALVFASCVSSTLVSFRTDVDGAEVYIDGVYVGKTPTVEEISNAIWEDPKIEIRKEGYRPIVTGLDKEVKYINVFLGIVCDWPAFLFSYGPKRYQGYNLIPDPAYDTDEI